MKYIQWYALAYLWCGEKQDETYTYGSRIREPVDQVEEAIKRYVEEKRDRQVRLPAQPLYTPPPPFVEYGGSSFDPTGKTHKRPSKDEPNSVGSQVPTSQNNTPDAPNGASPQE